MKVYPRRATRRDRPKVEKNFFRTFRRSGFESSRIAVSIRLDFENAETLVLFTFQRLDRPHIRCNIKCNTEETLLVDDDDDDDGNGREIAGKRETRLVQDPRLFLFRTLEKRAFESLTLECQQPISFN